MKAKELIALLQTVDPEAEIVTPGFDESGVAGDFTMVEVGIKFNHREATCRFAPHDTVALGTPGSTPGYELNGDW